MEIDPRSPRFSALITTAVLSVVLVTGSVWLLAAQALVFATGEAFSLRYSPYGMLYRRLVRARLGPPAELEPEAPPRFAQAVGLVFALVGVAGYAAGLTWLGAAATAAALVAAFLNAVLGFCLGCEMYLLIRRVWPGRPALALADADKEVNV
ncbi:MAG TPA: DUF4395 domain-containing protein [Streptosporangiaceae bacterium]|nr:DUF4395 domain-containing protein [Streptosporangiaceae bacterium]